MQYAKEKLEKLIGLELIVTLDTREEIGCEDEEYGHYLQCEPNFSNPIPEQEPPCIVIYENDHVQFFHDATPYPVEANRHHEREMTQFLCPYPVHVDLIIEEDFTNFINTLIEEYGD